MQSKTQKHYHIVTLKQKPAKQIPFQNMQPNVLVSNYRIGLQLQVVQMLIGLQDVRVLLDHHHGKPYEEEIVELELLLLHFPKIPKETPFYNPCQFGVFPL